VKVDEALNLYGTPSKLANALGCSIQSVYRWKKEGEIPEMQQMKLQVLTGGRLMADDFSAKNAPQRHPVTAQLEDELIKKAEIIGDGNRAKGIRIALAAYKKEAF